MEQYPAENIKITGETLIHSVEASGGATETVAGEHAEQVAFVNLQPGTTLDTNQLNRQGQQAFNLDLWAAIEQAMALGVDSNFAIGASLILYMATEIMLVESKGKPALPVVVRK